MEWVYGFISSFGGDPHNITLFGSASGATDILCHMHSVANRTRPLFQRAIIQSAVMELDIPNVHSAGWQFSKLMTCLQAHSINDLRAIPAEKLANYSPHVRAVDDGAFFTHGWRECLYPEAPEEKCRHEDVPELQAIRNVPHVRLRSHSHSRRESLPFSILCEVSPWVLCCCLSSLLLSPTMSLSSLLPSQTPHCISPHSEPSYMHAIYLFVMLSYRSQKV